MDQTYCGGYEMNHPISSTADADDIHASFVAVLENQHVTSLKVKHMDNSVIALAGSGSGQLLKVNRAQFVYLFLSTTVVLWGDN